MHFLIYSPAGFYSFQILSTMQFDFTQPLTHIRHHHSAARAEGNLVVLLIL